LSPEAERLIDALCVGALEMRREGITEESILVPWDSLCVLSTMAVIDEVLGIVVEGPALSDCKTIGDVLKIARLA